MQTSRNTCEWPMRYGLRWFLAIFLCLLPVYFVLFVLPVIPLALGHVKIPKILLSNFMSARATYQSLYIMGFGMPFLIISWLLQQACHHFKTRGVSSSALNIFMLLVNVPTWVGLATLLAFNFDSDDPTTLEARAHAFLHYAGTITYFVGAAAACWVYVSYVQPEGERVGAIHPKDASWLGVLGKQLVLSTVVLGLVRVGHITYPITWSIPMLLVECYTIAVAMSLGVLGHLRVFMHFDAVDPILDFSCFYETKSGKAC